MAEFCDLCGRSINLTCNKLWIVGKLRSALIPQKPLMDETPIEVCKTCMRTLDKVDIRDVLKQALIFETSLEGEQDDLDADILRKEVLPAKPKIRGRSD